MEQWIDYWSFWLAAACLLAVIELMTGTYFLLALAGGALITSLITASASPALGAQLGIFAVGSILCYMALTPLRKSKPARADSTNDMIGQRVEISEAIDPVGRAVYKGVSWRAESETPLAPGDAAVIERVRGSTLFVRPAE